MANKVTDYTDKNILDLFRTEDRKDYAFNLLVRKYLLPLINVEKKLSRQIETDAYFDGDELQIKLQKAILTLPEIQRIVFNMKYFDEMKYEEIAAIMNT